MAEDLFLYRRELLENGIERIAYSGKPDLYMDKDYNTIMSENCCEMGQCGKGSCNCKDEK